MTRSNSTDSSLIACPKCGHEFALTSALEQPIAERLRQQIEAEFVSRIEQEKEKAKEAAGVELQALKQEIAEKNKTIQQARDAELALRKKQREFEEQKQAFELEKQKQLDTERARIKADALKELEPKLKLQEQQLAETRRNELELLKQKSEFEEAKKSMDLEKARLADEVKQKTAKEKDEEFRLKQAEEAKKTADLNRQIDELKRKIEQGSQQAQGEVLELDLEEQLRRSFPFDVIDEVRKGALGADMKQHVRDARGNDCGTILWESKRTRAWSDQWLGKLKQNRMEAKAELAAIVSTAMPKDITQFGCRDDVWIMPPSLMVPVASMLRVALIEAAVARRSIEGQAGKQVELYNYLVSPQFKQRVGMIVEVYRDMQSDLVTEMRAIQKQWAKREKQIEKLASNTISICGELEGIAGNAMPKIEALDLKALAGPDKNQSNINTDERD